MTMYFRSCVTEGHFVHVSLKLSFRL